MIAPPLLASSAMCSGRNPALAPASVDIANGADPDIPPWNTSNPMYPAAASNG